SPHTYDLSRTLSAPSNEVRLMARTGSTPLGQALARSSSATSAICKNLETEPAGVNLYLSGRTLAVTRPPLCIMIGDALPALTPSWIPLCQYIYHEDVSCKPQPLRLAPLRCSPTTKKSLPTSACTSPSSA